MSQRIVQILIALVVLVVLAGFLFSFTVRFTETAVVSRFGKADAASVYAEPGVYLKWPYIDRVTKYDTRARFVELQQETQQTLDSKQVVVTAWVTWRVKNPLGFYQKFSNYGDRAEEHFREAEAQITARMKSAMSALSTYRFDELLSADGSKLPEVEAKVLAQLKSPGGDPGTSLEATGIEALQVGISAIKFPQAVSENVFARMRANRSKLANATNAQGKSTAENLKAQAKSDADRIMSFADRLAGNIRAQGRAEAEQYYKQLGEDSQLAVFLRQMEFMREAYGRSSTLVFPTSMPGMEWFRPDALEKFTQGKITGPSGPSRPLTMPGTAPGVGGAPATSGSPNPHTPPTPIAPTAGTTGKGGTR
jgi:membrane protease subunit HflC